LGKNPWKRDTEAYYSFPPRPVVPRTNKPHLQIVYTALYRACFHKMKKMVKLSDMDVSRRTGIDWRTVQRDLFWLTQSGDIEVVKEDHSRARRSGEKTLWSVPLANFDMKKQHFTPVPKFVVDHYVPVYPRAILLPVLQYIRQWRRWNGYWGGARGRYNWLAEAHHLSSPERNGRPAQVGWKEGHRPRRDISPAVSYRSPRAEVPLTLSEFSWLSRKVNSSGA